MGYRQTFLHGSRGGGGGGGDAAVGLAQVWIRVGSIVRRDRYSHFVIMIAKQLLI